MAHDHEHPKNATYFLDQLCTVATCGLLGMIAILMYRASGPQGQSKLSYILAPPFFIYVLLGGITVVALVIIRAITLWHEAGLAKLRAAPAAAQLELLEASRAQFHDHPHAHGDHDHAHDHGHEHAHDHHHHHDHNHDHTHEHHHDHTHDHGWTPARYAVLMLPIMLYFFNLPNSSFSAEYINRDLDKSELQGSAKQLADRGSIDLGFKELTNAAFYAQQREELEGKTGKLRGMFSRRRSDKEFTLYRVKINCCAADAIPVGVVIVSDENITQVSDGQWVEVAGQIQFQKEVGKDKFTPVLYLKSREQVKKIPKPSTDYGLD
jgi:uncharacterized repeat protein (TIGR03943 family)